MSSLVLNPKRYVSPGVDTTAIERRAQAQLEDLPDRSPASRLGLMSLTEQVTVVMHLLCIYRSDLHLCLVRPAAKFGP